MTRKFNINKFNHMAFGAIFFALMGIAAVSLKAQSTDPLDNYEPTGYHLGPTLEEYESLTTTETKKETPVAPPQLELQAPSFQPPVPEKFDQNQWNDMRHDMEKKEVTPPPPKVIPSTTTAQPPKPPPGQIYVELPYESSLSVTGRKVITVEIKNTHISGDQAATTGQSQNTQAFNMDQQLQARIQGTVARKTTINVNFDDTKENVRDFSVVYKGDPGEVVQEAAFGDIVLSLPSTEFVNYNKQLFGIRTYLRYKRAGFYAIGSRMKGTTETKRFTGATKRQQIFINDTAYVRRKYYDLSFSTAEAMRGPGGPLVGVNIPPISDASPERVYQQDTTGINPQAQTYLIGLATAPSSAIPIRMRLLNRGVDYSIDRIKGIITFTNQLNSTDRVAIDFAVVKGNKVVMLSSLMGTNRDAVLIKDADPEAPQASQEVKYYYNAGVKNITRDNGLGNFLLKLMDKNQQNEVGSTLNPRFVYPDTNQFEMDFDGGSFKILHPLPTPDLYAPNVVSNAPLNFVWQMEFNSIVRTFNLRPNIVLQSERVEVDGRKVNRDLDYYIDYDIGIITFFNADLIRENTVVEVTYEYAPVGGMLGETLVGARGTYDILETQKIGQFKMDKLSVGSTVLYDFAAKPTAPPDIRSAPSSILVMEGDTSLKNFVIPYLPFKNNLAVEAARSAQDPNIYGSALIDSMESIKQEDATAMLKDSWFISANPSFANSLGTYNSVADFTNRFDPISGNNHLAWDEVDMPVLNPESGQATSEKALTISYALNTTNNVVTTSSPTPEQISMIQPISNSGRDFSNKNLLQVEIQGAGASAKGTDLIIDIGTFNEDTDANDILGTEDINGDGVLNLGEDIGWPFYGSGPDLKVDSFRDSNGNYVQGGDDTVSRIGAVNGRLDSEDLNGDHALNTTDFPVNPDPNNPFFRLSKSVPEGDLSFTDRRIIQIPIDTNSMTQEEKDRLLAVRQVRVTLRNISSTVVPSTGSFKLIRISFVGNTYQTPVVTNFFSTMTVSGINNKDDAGVYVPPFGNSDYMSLYKDSPPASDAKEQSLAIHYDLLPNSSGTTRNLFSSARDFSKEKHLKFFIRRPPNSLVLPSTSTPFFFFQVGSESDYHQLSIPVQSIPYLDWKVVDIKQDDLNHDGTPETWTSDDPDVTIQTSGNNPSLVTVAQIKMGVVNASSTTDAVGDIWVDDIYQTESVQRIGHAKRVSFDSTWTNWMDFGGNYRYTDRNWQTPTTAITNQDNSHADGHLNLTKLKFMPMSFSGSREIAKTPSAYQANNNALVSFYQEGRVQTDARSANVKLIVPLLPTIDTTLTTHNEANNTTLRTIKDHTWDISANYSVPVAPDVLPGKMLTLRPLPTNISFRHSEKTTGLTFGTTDQLNFMNISTAPFDSTNLKQYTDENELKLGFKFWNGFTFNPAYRVSTSKERRNFRPDELVADPDIVNLNGKLTNRSLSQNVSAAGSLLIFKWLEPTYSYSLSGTETNGLPTLSNTTGYMLKDLNRSSQAEVSATIQMAKLVPRSKLLSSMTNNLNYRIEGGDSYQFLPSDFAWQKKLWAGTPLAVSSDTNSQAQRTSATDRRTFRSGTTWLPFSTMLFDNARWKPWTTLSVTSNYSTALEKSELTGTGKHVTSRTFPDLIFNMNNVEKLFNVKQVVSDSRLTVRANKKLDETADVTRNVQEAYGTDYNFKFVKNYDVSTGGSIGRSRSDNLTTAVLASKSITTQYFVQTRIPNGTWAYTPRYEHSQTDASDSVNVTNDLRTDIYSLQIYGDINKPIGLRFGRHEIDFANRLILNSTIKWEKRRSAINPQTNYVDLYTGTISGDYTLSKNFRLAIGGNYSQEKHYTDFSRLNQYTFGINSTLTIQF